MRKFSGVLQHSGCRRRRLAVNARAVCTFGARRARFVTTRKPLIPWHTSSWTAEYFKYSWHEVVAHRSGCAARSRIPSSGRAYLPDSDDSDDDDERLKTFEALNVTTATAQQPPLLPRGLASKDPRHFSLFFSFLSFFLSFFLIGDPLHVRQTRYQAKVFLIYRTKINLCFAPPGISIDTYRKPIVRGSLHSFVSIFSSI